VSLLILALLEGGNAWAWSSPISIGALAAAGVLLVAFVLVERRAEEPVLPLWVLSRRLLVSTSLISIGVGVVLIGLTSYVPTFLESLLRVSPLTSGLTLAALTLGWPIAATLSGRIYLRIGFRATVIIGASLVIVGTTALAVTARTPSIVAVGACCFVIGLGMGLVASPSLIAAQSSVGWGERGVVTGTNMFARSVGSAVGVAVLGALVNARLDGTEATEDPALFGDAVTWVFVAVVVTAAATLLAGVSMPRGQRVGGA
jgi:MFS family permease